MAAVPRGVPLTRTQWRGLAYLLAGLTVIAAATWAAIATRYGWIGQREFWSDVAFDVVIYKVWREPIAGPEALRP